MREIKFGVPQGSILGPLLFIPYISDLPNASKLLHSVIFADDTNLLFHNNEHEFKDVLNVELQKVNTWFKSNKLSLNISKMNYILFHSRQNVVEPFCLNIDGTSFQEQNLQNSWGSLSTNLLPLQTTSISWSPNSLNMMAYFLNCAIFFP